MATRRDDAGENGGANAAALIRRAALWVSPIVLATAMVVSYTINDRRDVEYLRESYKRDILEIRDKLDRITRDITDRLNFVDRDGLRDPVLRMALDRHVAEVIKQMDVLTKPWAVRLKDKNPLMILPE